MKEFRKITVQENKADKVMEILHEITGEWPQMQNAIVSGTVYEISPKIVYIGAFMTDEQVAKANHCLKNIL